MDKKDKCCKDGYQNLANVVSLFRYLKLQKMIR